MPRASFRPHPSGTGQRRNFHFPTHPRLRQSPKPPAHPEPVEVPEFTPVPRQCQRHDGWTADRQRRFIEALADLGSVKSAAHAVNMTPEGAYLLRRHPQAEVFDSPPTATRTPTPPPAASSSG